MHGWKKGREGIPAWTKEEEQSVHIFPRYASSSSSAAVFFPKGKYETKGGGEGEGGESMYSHIFS